MKECITKYELLNEGVPIVRITESGISYSKAAQDYMGLTLKGRVSVAFEDGNMYISVAPFNKEHGSFAVYHNNGGTKTLYTYCDTFKLFEEKGVFKLLPPVYIKGTDWFELEKINDEKI